MSKYYDGTKLLSLKDLNGNTPEIFICTSNRTAGKTTYFNRLLLRRFTNRKEKFMLLYRFNYELDDCADKFFKDINGLFFPDGDMRSERRANGIYHELFYNDEPCGYAVSINSADQIKKMAHLFSDVSSMLFDEFQSETNHYCANEVGKFISVHQSVARGKNEQVRYVPVYMVGNPVSIINPHYVAMGISSRLRDDTRFLKGDGFVLEQGFNESASQAQQCSGFNRAFASSQYVAYASQGIYLNDNKAFIEKPESKGRYIATVKYQGVDYGVREYIEEGIIYCDARPDATFPFKIVTSTDDHNVNYVMLKRNDTFISDLRWYFERGAFRFKDLRAKEAILATISY